MQTDSHAGKSGNCGRLTLASLLSYYYSLTGLVCPLYLSLSLCSSGNAALWKKIGMHIHSTPCDERYYQLSALWFCSWWGYFCLYKPHV